MLRLKNVLIFSMASPLYYDVVIKAITIAPSPPSNQYKNRSILMCSLSMSPCICLRWFCLMENISRFRPLMCPYKAMMCSLTVLGSLAIKPAPFVLVAQLFPRSIIKHSQYASILFVKYLELLVQIVQRLLLVLVVKVSGFYP